ncbi:MAG: glutamate synthase subunit alpha [Methanosaeta sp. PtaB.Bin039]|nr:MAG: glutamate synthase subunit alpha [Methanosaeta sp. PtaB.Bin039]OPY47667.1 MAG: glutamate synthase subunit alpha [Methanosaeta sp. PtaU1.Bin028]HOT06732.1 glutamine amidotransferase family protein [Methanotrichaceae archaeon]HQF16382.1 glutamine amidotransferase family protein [Methanotrichaceae archaeon]HQI91004.1 glutamine amidotransferase family protein [Methanotrichaceae archaeon]
MTRRTRRRLIEKEICSCSIFGAMNRSGERFGGGGVIEAIANMHVRGNGLGGGFAAYGIYPHYRDYYAFHLMFTGTSESVKRSSKAEFDAFLHQGFQVVHDEEIPCDDSVWVRDPPLAWRYFVLPDPKGEDAKLSEEDYIVDKVMWVNTRIDNAYIFSSGKDMGVFKGVGFPEEIGRYFMLDREYRGNIWTAHGRFPTNTQAWWGGAHPFGLLDWTVVHNGEISSYGTNRRYLEMYGYKCTLQTDTEVITYAVDLLMRRQRLPIELVARILSPPIWNAIDRMGEKERSIARTLRMVYGPLLMNGPFTIIIAHHGEMIGLTDRVRLRPLTAAARGDMMYLSSEEAPIRLISPQLDEVWTPNGGEPVVGQIRC